MGAPPGVGSASSAPAPSPGAPSNSVPLSSGPAAPPSTGPTAPTQFVPASDPLPPDETRLRLAKGLRLFSENHLDSARLGLQPVAREPLGKAVLDKIEDDEARFRAIQASAVLKSLALDYGRERQVSPSQRDKLGSALGDVESQLLAKPSVTWSQAIEEAKKGMSSEVLQAWLDFSTGEKSRLSELESLFKEKDRELLASGLMNLAERLRKQHYFSTAWTLAQLATEFPQTQPKAKALIEHLEGLRSTNEYVISDMFDNGGTSMAINLVSLFPAVAGGRRLSTWSRLASKSFFLRYPATLLGGGALHWTSTKALMGMTGYNGQIMPNSWGELGTEFASSTAQTGLALLLANRFWKIKPATAKEAESATVSAVGFRQRAVGALAKTPRALWWTTKTTLKVGTVTAGDLATQWGFHAAGWKNMTPQGFPEGLVKTVLPGVHETRQTVIGTYEARKLLDQHHKAMIGQEATASDRNVIEPGFKLDLFLTELDPSLDGDRREMAYAVLATASAEKKLGLNIRRWILHKKKAGEFAGANKTLEQQGIPLRLDQDGFVCFKDSKTFPCP